MKHNSGIYLAVMLQARICVQCERLLNEASSAMRRHAAAMDTAFELVRSNDSKYEQYRENVTAKLWESFNEAQSAWNTYREHLVEHGLVPSR